MLIKRNYTNKYQGNKQPLNGAMIIGQCNDMIKKANELDKKVANGTLALIVFLKCRQRTNTCRVFVPFGL